MKNKKNLMLILVLTLALAFLVTNCTTCKSSQYRRKHFSSVDNYNINLYEKNYNL